MFLDELIWELSPYWSLELRSGTSWYPNALVKPGYPAKMPELPGLLPPECWWDLSRQTDKQTNRLAPQTAQVARPTNLTMPYHGSQKGKSYLKVGKIYIATSLWQQSSLPACLSIGLFVCVPQNQTLPGCTGTRKQQDPDAAAPRGLWERSLSGRGISFHDSVSAALPESRKWEVGGKEIRNQWLGWQESAQGPPNRARCYFLLCLLPGWFQLPSGKVMRSRVFFALLTQSD